MSTAAGRSMRDEIDVAMRRGGRVVIKWRRCGGAVRVVKASVTSRYIKQKMDITSRRRWHGGVFGNCLLMRRAIIIPNQIKRNQHNNDVQWRRICLRIINNDNRRIVRMILTLKPNRRRYVFYGRGNDGWYARGDLFRKVSGRRRQFS